MPYVGADGNLVHSKPWTFKSIIDFFWSFVMFFVFFVRGLLHLDEPDTRGQYGRAGLGRAAGYAPGVPRRRMGGFSSGASGAPAPPPCGAGG